MVGSGGAVGGEDIGEMIPIPWLAGGLALAVAVSGVSGFVAGIKWEKPKRIALEASYKTAAAQAAGREAERGRLWKQAVILSAEKYDASLKINSGRARTELERLRDSAATRDRVRTATETTGNTPATCGATRAELLRFGEAVVGLAEQAATADAGLRACVGAWPR